MADRLHSLTALGRAVPHRVEIGPVRIVERFDLALASVACRKGRAEDLRSRAAAAAVPLPDPARAVAATPYGAFWVAPDMWFVEAPFATHEEIVAPLRAAFGDAASITEQTDAWVVFDLDAPDLAPLFERLCPVDLSRAPDGFATRTVIEHIGCYLLRSGPGRVRLYGPRSSAGSLLHALETAATSVL